jgi:hypothetical protein
MWSSHTITLFSDRPVLNQGPSSFMFSILAHGGAIGLLLFGVANSPRMNEWSLTERYNVRQLELKNTEAQRRRAANHKIDYPSPQSLDHKSQPDEAQGMKPPLLQQITKAPPGLQTLVQPNLPPLPPLTQPIPVPNVVMWTPEKIQVKVLVAPKQDIPTAAETVPSLQAPNREVAVADVRISATDLPSQNMPVLPSTTSPLVVHGPNLPQRAPSTTSMSSGDPTPADVLSLSGNRMTTGTVFLPPTNSSVSTASAGTENGDPASKGAGAGMGKGANEAGGAKTGPAQGANSGSGTGDGDLPSTTHIALAKEGAYGAVVVGNSLAERYPEAAALLSGRLVYTVYLHLGLAKSWILQYTLPRSDDAAAAGNTTSLDAPWPYDIVRPNIPAGGIDADVLMIHGFVNKDGRFETLSVAFPPQFAHAQFVVDALKQWEFRPAKQGGKATRVEVLLIVPAASE